MEMNITFHCAKSLRWAAALALAPIGATVAHALTPTENVSVYTLIDPLVRTYSIISSPTSPTLFAGNANDGLSSMARIYEKFVLPAYVPGKAVTSAVFSMQYGGYLDVPPPADSYLYVAATTNNWTASTITWQNMPPPVGAPLGIFNPGYVTMIPGTTASIDLTSYVDAAYQAGGVVSFVILSPVEGSVTNDWRYFTPQTQSLGVTISAIPEPSTYTALGGIAVLGFAIYRRRQGK